MLTKAVFASGVPDPGTGGPNGIPPSAKVWPFGCTLSGFDYSSDPAARAMGVAVVSWLIPKSGIPNGAYVFGCRDPGIGVGDSLVAAIDGAIASAFLAGANPNAGNLSLDWAIVSAWGAWRRSIQILLPGGSGGLLKTLGKTLA
jgi:hypothetical protein